MDFGCYCHGCICTKWRKEVVLGFYCFVKYGCVVVIFQEYKHIGSAHDPWGVVYLSQFYENYLHTSTQTVKEILVNHSQTINMYRYIIIIRLCQINWKKTKHWKHSPHLLILRPVLFSVFILVLIFKFHGKKRKLKSIWFSFYKNIVLICSFFAWSCFIF